MIIPKEYRIKNTIKYPTSLIIGGLNRLGFEIANSLMEQGGYVIIVDSATPENLAKLDQFVTKRSLISFIDYTSIPHLDEDLRRLDYVFYFAHNSIDYTSKVSTQEFLTFSNYLDAILALSTKFDAKFLLTTSIKANQTLLSEQQLQGLDYGISNTAKHSVYTDMEVQRYAEGLTLEYNEKTGLDTRITRLGEIIGDGIDFSVRSEFNQLILSAAKGDFLRLKNDGLETEWLVHILDCSYALIKAQFSKNTSGKMFSVCYDNSFTHLSIAYKIQEVEEGSKEIQFVDEKNSKLTLKLYKPTPNLASIGWMPRVPFDRAVKQSIASAKIYLSEQSLNDGVEQQGGDPLHGSLNGFLALAKKGLQQSDNETSPINRLIAERRRQEEIKKNKLGYATNDLMAKRKYRARNFNEKLQNVFWGSWTRMSQTFTVLQRKSPFEMASIVILVVFLFSTYFLIFSPFLVLLRDSLVLVPEFTQADVSVKNNDYKSLIASINKINTSIQSVKDNSSRFKGIFEFLNLKNQYNELEQLIQSYSLASEGTKDISSFLDPYSNYIDAYKNNVQLRNGTDSFISTSENGLDYTPILSKMNERAPYLDSGYIKLEKAVQNIKAQELKNLPASMSNFFQSVNKSIIDNSESLKNINYLKYIPELIGMNATKTHLLLALDNTRLTPVGGDIAGVGMVTFNKGAITEIKFQSAAELANTQLTLTTAQKTELNLQRYNDISDKVTLKEVSSTLDYAAFSDILRTNFAKTYKREIDGVISLNLSSIEALTALNANFNLGDLFVSGINFSNTNPFLNNLNATQLSNPNIVTKQQVISELTSDLIYSFSSNFKRYNLFSSVITDQSKNSNFQGNFTSDVQKFSDKTNLQNSQFYVNDAFIEVGINLDDPNIVSLDRFPNVDMSIQSTFDAEFNLTNKLNIKFPNYGAVQDVITCLPVSVKVSSINVLNVSKAKITTQSGDQKVCVIVRVTTEDQLTINFEIEEMFDNTRKMINFSYGVAKVKGALTSMDMQLTAPASFALLLTSQPDLPVSNGTIVLSKSNLSANQGLIFRLTRP